MGQILLDCFIRSFDSAFSDAYHYDDFGDDDFDYDDNSDDEYDSGAVPLSDGGTSGDGPENYPEFHF